MKSQWYSRDRYAQRETICFAPLTLVFLPCSCHTWSYHGTAIPCCCSSSSCFPTWELARLGFTLHCCSLSLSPCSTCPEQLTCLTHGPPAPPKWLFFVWLQRKSHTVGLSYALGLLSVGSCLNGAQLTNTLPAAIWGSTELWNDPVFRETELQWGKTCLHTSATLSDLLY